VAPPTHSGDPGAAVDSVLDDARRRRDGGGGLRWQVLATLLGVFLAVVVLIGVAVTGLMRRQPQHELVRSRLRATELLAAALSGPHVDDADRRRLIAAVERDRSLRWVDVLAADGHRLATTTPQAPSDLGANEVERVLRTCRPEHVMRTTASGDRELVVVVPLAAATEPCEGVVGAAWSLATVDEHANAGRNLVWLYLAVSAIAMLSLAYYLLTRLVIRPLRTIADGTQRLARGDYDHRVKVRGTNEVAQLATEFNSMARQLAGQRASVEQKVAELERAYENLERAQLSLVRSEKLATVGRLAAGVAHEIGNPLTAVVGYIELLSDGDLDPEDAADLIRRIDREVHRIDSIVRDLLDYSRAEATSLDAHNLSDVVQSAIHLVEAQPRFRQITVLANLPTQLPPVIFNEGRMQQVLVNLLLNAADAIAERGEIRISAARSAREGRAGVVIEVADDGCGIPDLVRARIFEPFFTTKEPGQGTGLGLAISQSIIASFGGDIEVRSAPGEGTTFSLWLPALPRRAGEGG